MFVIPAVDLLDGKVVRLKKGIMEDASVYSDNPLEWAEMFYDSGAERIHIVDLNGARTGENANFRQIEKIASKIPVKIEIGGGIRNMERLNDFFNMGVSFCILGTAAVKNPDFAFKALDKYPDRIILGYDAINGMIAVEGWYESTKITIKEALDKYKDMKAESVILTDINKDGMLSGVNLSLTDEAATMSPFPIIASGGVSSLQDIKDIISLNNGNIKGCIAGKAIYEGKINLKEALSL